MDSLELLSAVNEFYDGAFNRLMAVTFGVIAFIGVLVPVIVGWVQIRSLRNEKDSVMRDLKSEIEKEREAARHEIEKSVREEVLQVRASLERRIEELSNELRKSSADAEARSFHLQGNNLKKDGNHAIAADDFACATRLYIEAYNEANAQRCLGLLINDCLPKTIGKEYKLFKIDKACEKLLEKLTECNENGRYANSIDQLERAMEAAANREPPEKPEKDDA